MDAPAWRVTELDTGHVVVVAADNPVQKCREADGAVDRLKSYLGIGT